MNRNFHVLAGMRGLRELDDQFIGSRLIFAALPSSVTLSIVSATESNFSSLTFGRRTEMLWVTSPITFLLSVSKRR